MREGSRSAAVWGEEGGREAGRRGGEPVGGRMGCRETGHWGGASSTMKTEGLAVPVRLLACSAEATRLELTWLAWGKGRTHVREAVVGGTQCCQFERSAIKSSADGGAVRPWCAWQERGWVGGREASLSPER